MWAAALVSFCCLCTVTAPACEAKARNCCSPRAARFETNRVLLCVSCSWQALPYQVFHSSVPPMIVLTWANIWLVARLIFWIVDDLNKRRKPVTRSKFQYLLPAASAKWHRIISYVVILAFTWIVPQISLLLAKSTSKSLLDQYHLWWKNQCSSS